jgi:hypothetical protein
MGHVRYAGRVTEEERFGARVGRVDVPGKDGGFTTVYFGGQSVYRLIPVTEEVARVAARRNQPEPVHAWDLPHDFAEKARSLTAAVGAGGYSTRDDDDDDDTVDDDHLDGVLGF